VKTGRQPVYARTDETLEHLGDVNNSAPTERPLCTCPDESSSFDQRRKTLFQEPPVNRLRQLHQRVPHIDDLIQTRAEQIPFPDGHFDIVTSFNSLDHVDDLARTIHEIKRVAKPNGHFLLIVEIDHPPTPTEPLTLTKDILNSFGPEFRPVKHWASAMGTTHDVYNSVLAAKTPSPGEPAILCADLTRH